MRILAVSHAYPSRRSSSHGIFIHRLHLGLEALGADVHVLQPVDWSPPWPLNRIDATWREAAERRGEVLDELDGIPIHHPVIFTPRPSRFFSTDTWEAEGLALKSYTSQRDALKSADVVLSHFMVPDGVSGLALARALGVPSAAFAWGDDLHAWPEQRPTWRPKLEMVLRQVDLPIACSERMRDDGNAWLDVPRSDWAIVYGGVDLERFKPGGDRVAARRRILGAYPMLQDPSVRVVLMIGQRVKAKGYIELLDAWKTVSKDAPEWHLVMAGSDAGDVDMEKEIADRSVTSCAHWIGPQAVETIPELLTASDAFVLPSHNEGLSLSALEAMATGLPTITTDVGGHRELIRCEDEGWLIPARDTPSLGRALRELMESDERRGRIAKAARAAAARIGSPSDNAVRLAEALERVARRPAKA